MAGERSICSSSQVFCPSYGPDKSLYILFDWNILSNFNPPALPPWQQKAFVPVSLIFSGQNSNVQNIIFQTYEYVLLMLHLCWGLKVPQKLMALQFSLVPKRYPGTIAFRRQIKQITEWTFVRNICPGRGKRRREKINTESPAGSIALPCFLFIAAPLFMADWKSLRG